MVMRESLLRKTACDEGVIKLFSGYSVLYGVNP